MTNNDVLRRVRYIFDLSDAQMISLFRGAGPEVTRAEVSDWLKREDDPAYQRCEDAQLASFLNSFIDERRGKRPGTPLSPEPPLNNNTVLRRLKIALNLQADEMLEVLAAGGVQISKHELSALFRKSTHKHYRECKDQLLRAFLKGLQMRFRPGTETLDDDVEGSESP